MNMTFLLEMNGQVYWNKKVDTNIVKYRNGNRICLISIFNKWLVNTLLAESTHPLVISTSTKLQSTMIGFTVGQLTS